MGPPDPRHARLEQVRAELRNGQYFRARQALEAMNRAGQVTSAMLELLGIARAKTGDLDAACEALEAATRLAPGDASPHFNYAMLLAQMGQLDDAASEVNVALYLAPDHPGAHALRTNVVMRLRNRAHRAPDQFHTVEARPDPVSRPSTEWARLKCQSCGALNFVTAKVCSRCGTLLSQEEPVVPLE